MNFIRQWHGPDLTRLPRYPKTLRLSKYQAWLLKQKVTRRAKCGEKLARRLLDIKRRIPGSLQKVRAFARQAMRRS